MTSYDSQTTVTIAGTDYTGRVLRGVNVTIGRRNIMEQPQAGYARIVLWDDWGTVYQFEPNVEVVVKIWNPQTSAQQAIFTGTLVQHEVDVMQSGVLGGIAGHTITAVGPLAELARKQYDTSSTLSAHAGTVIGNIISDSYSATWNAIGDQYTWATFPSTLTWADLDLTGPVGTIDDGGYTIALVDEGIVNSLDLARRVADSALGVFGENAAGEFDFRDIAFRKSLTATALTYDHLTPDLRTSMKQADIVNQITTIIPPGFRYQQRWEE